MAIDPDKPRKAFCRLSELMRWTGWSEREIAAMVRSGDLKTFYAPGHVLAKYDVDSAQQIKDDGRFSAKRRPKRAKK